jgi:large subunit ribosomal protein L24
MGKVTKIKKNDIVQAIAGEAKTSKATGKVLQVLPEKGKAIVEGLNYIHKTVRKTQDNPQGGIVRKEAPIAISNLLLYCPDCKKGVKVSRERNEKGKLVRKCKKCGKAFD